MPTSPPADGGQAAEPLETLVSNHRTFLAFLERRLGSRALAEDVLQDAFVKGIDKVEGLRDDESAIAWFYRVLRNAVVDQHRRQAAHQRALASFADELEAAAPVSEAHAEICRCVGELSRTLKPEYEAALRRIELDGVAVKDYAVEAGISRGNAAVRVFRAREALRERVARSCGTCADHGCVSCTCERTR
jgi:RNA polymerase sigma-70 factor (ECF subfamily)